MSIVVVAKMLAELKAAGVSQARRIVRNVRIRKCGPDGRDQDKCIVWICLSDLAGAELKAQRDSSIHQIAQFLGGKVMDGVAPPTKVERDVNEALKQLQTRIEKLEGKS